MCFVHYRTFYLKAEKTYKANKPMCLGSRSRATVSMDYVKDLFDTYADIPKISFSWLSDYSHSSTDRLKTADEDLLEFIKELDKKNHLNNILLILMSDHGARFDKVRQLVQGRYEERLPYIGMLFPKHFQQRYPVLMENFKSNIKSLTTGYDLHATLKHILESDFYQKEMYKTLHGISLLSPIPVNRTCTDASIQPHWCSCLDWRKVRNNSDEAIRATEYVIKFINDVVFKSTSKCQNITLKSVDIALKFVPNKKLLQFKGTKIENRRGKALFGEAMSTDFVLLQVTFTTIPSEAKYEATVKYHVANKVFSAKTSDISRLNAYGNQSACIQKEYPHLSPYCQCASH